MRPNATTWYFKPVRYLGEWKLCFRSSAQGTVHFTLLHNNIEEFPAETAYTYH